ncbi:MAG: HAD-IIIC family phosphatase [Gemmatimonadota bacterium]
MSGVLVADFNTQNLAAVLRNSEEPPVVEVLESAFGQVDQALIDPGHPAWASRPDFALIWTRPEAVLPTYRRAAAFESVDPGDLSREVARFVGHLLALRERVGTVIVPTWLAPRGARGLGPLEMTHPLGLRRLVLEANVDLVRGLGGAPGVFVLDAEDWIRLPDEDVFSDRLFYLAKIPFTNPVFHHAAADVKALLRSGMGSARKLIVLDLDDTLWGGLVGEDGWEGLRVGGHDPDGEAYADFQGALKALTNRGVLLALASKNQEAVALAAIERHPEMILRRDDFAAWRIDWNDKAQNIADIAAELNLGLDSVVFIDDSAAERARVREALPDVFVPEWPRSPSRYARELRALRCFDSQVLTEEDRSRATMYRARREQDEERANIGSIEEWLRTLQTEVEVERLDKASLGRAAQLLNKTNQMNLATRRLPEAGLWRWTEQPAHEFWTFRVSDRFGSHGLTGLLGVATDGETLDVVDFVMSCRVLGRNLERSMIAWAVGRARAVGCERIRAELLTTDRNRPCLDFLNASGLRPEGGRVFVWEASEDYAVPEGVSVVEPAD